MTFFLFISLEFQLVTLKNFSSHIFRAFAPLLHIHVQVHDQAFSALLTFLLHTSMERIGNMICLKANSYLSLLDSSGFDEELSAKDSFNLDNFLVFF